MNLAFQGTIDTTDGNKIECPYDNMIISLIVINNITANYNVTVNRFDSENSGATTLLYKFTLDNGDSVRDATQYKMSKGDYIELKSTVASTTYYVSADIT